MPAVVHVQVHVLVLACARPAVDVLPALALAGVPLKLGAGGAQALCSKAWGATEVQPAHTQRTHCRFSLLRALLVAVVETATGQVTALSEVSAVLGASIEHVMLEGS